MTIRITITDLSNRPIPVSEIDLRLPQESFGVLGIPNFAGGPDPTLTIVPSVRQIGGAIMRVTAELPPPIDVAGSSTPIPALVEAWREDAKDSLVSGFTFEAMDFIAVFTFEGASRPELETLVRDWTFVDDILSQRPFINGERFDPDAGNRPTAGDDTLEGTDGPDAIEGRGGDDSITGGKGADTLSGQGGDDTLVGNEGPDRLIGGPGNDQINGVEGADTLLGGGGSDALTDFGFERGNVLKGGAGNDVLYARTGSRLEGGGGNDNLRVDDGANRLFGNAGNDTLIGGFGKDTLKGGGGADDLLARGAREAGQGGDILDGQAGGDTLTGGTGRDTMKGGTGADSFVFVFVGDDGARSPISVGRDLIRDFDPAEGDRIELIGFDGRLRDATEFGRNGATIAVEGQGQIEIRFDGTVTDRTFFGAVDIVDI